MENNSASKVADANNYRRWVVAIVNHNSERLVADKLIAMGYDAFVASQTEMGLRKNGKKTKVERVIIPSMVFVYVTETERREIVNLPFIFRFLTNKARQTSSVNSPIAVIPDTQMENLRFMLGKSDSPVSFVNHVFGKNERVKVVRGKLCGLEGVVQSTTQGKSTLVIEVDFLGGASITIDSINLQPIN